MQQRLSESYLLFADSTAASLSPVGAAWKKMRDTYPNVELYNPDESHPSINGSYLAACVFYCTLFQKSCVGSQYLPGGVGNADAFYMQQIADNIVLDSIENWQSKGHIPFADFSFSASPNPSLFSFTNSSKRFTSSLWHFNDGSNTDTTTNPFHVFPNTTSTYNVCLEVKSACGKKDSVCKTIMVNGTGTANVQAGSDIIITQHARYIYLHHLNKNVTAQLFDLNGRCIMSEELLSPSATMDLSKYLPGVYVLCLADDYLRIVTKKIVIY